jgi:hypothetical protein
MPEYLRFFSLRGKLAPAFRIPVSDSDFPFVNRGKPERLDCCREPAELNGDLRAEEWPGLPA